MKFHWIVFERPVFLGLTEDNSKGLMVDAYDMAGKLAQPINAYQVKQEAKMISGVPQIYSKAYDCCTTVMTA